MNEASSHPGNSGLEQHSRMTPFPTVPLGAPISFVHQGSERVGTLNEMDLAHESKKELISI